MIHYLVEVFQRHVELERRVCRVREKFVWFSTVQQVVSFDPFQNKFLHVCHFHVRRFRSPRETYIYVERKMAYNIIKVNREKRKEKKERKNSDREREREEEEDKPMNQTSITSILVKIRVIIKERNPQSNQMFVQQIRTIQIKRFIGVASVLVFT